ncbi:MAG: cytochrome c peroxidase [Myxococcota bacterium]
MLVTLAGACGEAERETSVAAASPPIAAAAAVDAHPVRAVINPRMLRRFHPVGGAAVAAPPAPALVELGRMLWFDGRLSASGRESCDSCHTLERFGVDGRPTSLGDLGHTGRRNAPTVYNCSQHFAFFWDGRAKALEAQALGPILDPGEMDSTAERVEATLRSVPEYRARFAAVFAGDGEPVTMAHVARSLAAFERGLVTRSRFDEYLAGRDAALGDQEVEGLRVFIEVGCVTCHTGPQVGASTFQKAGAVEAWPNQADQGRFELTKDPADRMMFKVPGLMNVARTAPYFHDGSVGDLATAVTMMGRHQLGLELRPDEVAAIVAFLGALSGELPRDYIKPPALPPTVADEVP